MEHSSEQVGWEDLPYEIISGIISHIRDLGSLGALLHASPVVYRSFGDAARNLVEEIFASGYICGHTAVLFRLCALIRTGKLPVSDTYRFREHVTSEALLYWTRVRESDTGIAPRSLNQDIDASIVRSLLVVARLASNLAADCLATYLENLKTIHPQHPVQGETFDGYSRWPEGQYIKISTSDKVFWDEEQRATRAVWRLQLIYELKRAVKVGILQWTDTPVLISTKAIGVDLQVTPDEPLSFYGTRDKYLELVAKNLRAIPTWDGTTESCPEYSPEYEEINSLIQFVHRKYGADVADGMRNGILSLTDLTYADNSSRFRLLLQPSKNEWRKLVGPSDSVRFYFHGRRWPSSSFTPLLYTSFDEFAVYGFAFWAFERMVDCGLLGRKQTDKPKYHYAWYSLLAKKDIERIERVQREDAMVV